MKRDGGSVFPASANTGDPTGPVEAYRFEIARALISMMARSQRSKQKPDKLMQDRLPPTRRSSLATHGRTIHLGQYLPNSDASAMSAIASTPEVSANVDRAFNSPPRAKLSNSEEHDQLGHDTAL
jgi:hypothetical protein